MATNHCGMDDIRFVKHLLHRKSQPNPDTGLPQVVERHGWLYVARVNGRKQYGYSTLEMYAPHGYEFHFSSQKVAIQDFRERQ